MIDRKTSQQLSLQIQALIDGSISESEFGELKKTLANDEDARKQYMSEMEFESLIDKTIADKTISGLLSAVKDSNTDFGANNVSKGLRLTPGLVGAILATACMLGLLLFYQFRPDANEHSQNSLSHRMLSSVEPIADDCQWFVEQVNRNDAAAFRPGDVIRVSSGNLALQYTNGTRVVLRSPAAYELISLSSARMIIGRLTATVAEAGKGFTVVTPKANVIDLGTEFGVEVNDDGATDVVVFKGEVDLDYHDRNSQAQRLRMGEAVRLDAVGTTSRLVWVNGDSYSDQSSKTPPHRPLITEVRDNIERDSSVFNFYEIVAGGVKEDALAYVDRIAHQYNGITEEGMPSYLINADYVKVFNSDKFNKSTQVEVTLDRPAKLYVLFDNRHEPPQWLTEEFKDTGDDIGLDNGPFQTVGPKWHNRGPTGIGPGKSIDDEMSIWVKEVNAAGVVRLGPTGTTIEVGANMYGIMATPLELLISDE